MITWFELNDTDIKNTKLINGVLYELYKSDDKGAVRIYDMDAEELVAIIYKLTFADATKYFNECVRYN